MRHDAAIPTDLHAGAASSVKEALGAFWSTIFRDQELIDAALSARVLSACQAYIDAMEALSLRDHVGMPVFHREHWHPLLVRLSERNTGCGLTVGMEGGPALGPQGADGADTVFRRGEVFLVGGNAEFSKVDTYPLDAATRGRLVSVGTCICDSIAFPEHVLVQGRDFDLRGDVLLVRKEHDPFSSGGYLVVEDGDDRVAVLWMCDAEFDRGHVGDFLAYPLGFDVRSTRESAGMLSALWDVVVHGMTPEHMNILLGAIYGIPVLKSGSVIESVTDADGSSTVVTDDSVYLIRSELLSDCVVEGARLEAGTFLTNEISVYHGLSNDEFVSLVDCGRIPSLTLPPGSVAGVDEDVTLVNVESTLVAGRSGNAEWFKLNDGDSADSPFWTAVFGRTTAAERTAMCTAVARGGDTVNPLKALGYLAMANTVLVYARKEPLPGMCAAHAIDMLRRLVPSFGEIRLVQVPADGVQSPGAGDEVSMDDSVTTVVMMGASASSSMGDASDRVVVRFFPDAITEV